MQKVCKAGDVSIGDLTIISSNGVALNVLPQLVILELYESLYDPFMSGKIVLTDTQAIRDFFPLVGNEILKVSFETPTLGKDYVYTAEFFIYESSDSQRNMERTSVYALNFISKEAILDRNKRISKTFKGNPVDMLEYLLRDNGLQTEKELIAEEPRNQFAFCSNWWRPTKAIKFLSERCVSANGQPAFLFFENKNGFIFSSLDTLINKEMPLSARFRLNDYTRSMDDKATSYRDLEKDYQSILQIEYHNGFDYFRRLENGFYGGELITLDLTTRRYTHNAFNRPFENDSHLNEYSPVSGKPLAVPRGHLTFIPKMYNNFDGFGDSTNGNTAVDRDTIFARLNAQRLTIKVYGRTDYTVGQKVSVTIPKSGQINDRESTYDKLLSGVYLVTGLCHNITPRNHQTIMELAKDSSAIDLNKSGLES